MERRVLIAIFLSFLVIYSYQALFVRPVPTPPAGAETQTGSTATPGTAGQPAVAGAPGAAAPVQPSAPGVAPLVGDAAERETRVETDHVIATFTNRGGRLKSWQLKRFRDSEGQPLELVAHDLADQPLPFSLKAEDDATSNTLNNAFYTVRETPVPGSATPSIAFEYRDTAGLSALKEYRFDPAPFTLGFQATVSKNGQMLNPTIVWGAGLGDGDSQTIRSAVKPGAIYSVAGSVSRHAASAVTSQPEYKETFEYAGIDDHYFMAIALNLGAATVSYKPRTISPPAGSSDPARELMEFSVQRERGDQAVTFYLGPKDFETLATIDRNLVKSIHFGMFSVLVVPLLRSLNWINGFVGNYGWSIVLLTLFINLVLFPLNHKSVVSMRKMQEIQPETKAIQERYAKLKATDPAKQKMNQELMALYRERGVNPASGCVPILLTLPVFLAFYSLLTTAIELRGAPFFGWIHDLSQPDAYYVMPVLVGISQIVTQWMTPQAGIDPTQQKVMLIMPVVLIFVFISTPSGALIYWLIGNVWRLGQMYLTNYLIGPPNIKTIRPAAERRVKRAGAGKTEGAMKES